MVFEKFKNYYILRYIIYDFLKKVSGGNRPTCLVRVHCAMPHTIVLHTVMMLKSLRSVAIVPGQQTRILRLDSQGRRYNKYAA